MDKLFERNLRIVPFLVTICTRAVTYCEKLIDGLRNRRRSWLIDRFVIAAISAAIFSVFARFDPDPHHDGFQLAPAVGVSEGRVIHREIYSHYGPVSAWINGAWLWVTEPTLLSLRLLGAIQLALIAVLLYSLSIKLGVSRNVSWFITIAWVISCPVWAYESGFFGLWLWPSITFNLIALVVALLLIRIPPRGDRSNNWTNYFYFIGFLLGLALLIRTKEGLVLLVAFFLVLIHSHRAVGLIQAAVSFAITLVLFSLALLLTGSFNDWLNQTIIGPFTNLESVSVGGFDWSYFKSIYLGGDVRQTVGLLAVLIGLIYLYQKFEVRRLLRTAILVLVIAIGHFVLLKPSAMSEMFGLYGSTYTAKSILTYTVLIRFGLLLSLVGITVLAVDLTLTLFKKVRSPIIQRQEILISSALTLGAVANLYPLPDIYHLWWASPSLLLFVAVLTKGLFKQKVGNAIIVVVVFFVSALIPLNTLKAIKDTQQPRVVWSDGSLQGMLIHESIIPSFVAAEDVLKKINRPADFSNCRDPLWAVFFGRYMSVNKYYSIVPSYLAQAPTSGLLVDCGQGSFQRNSSSSIQEIAATPEYLNSFSTFSSVDKIFLIEVQLPLNRP